MSNQIREAVDAAVVAAWDDNQRRILYPTNRPFSDLPEPTQALWRADAVATIAAFLRALPDQYSRGGASFWDAIPAVEETRLWLAAAVERASQEPPHA